MLVQQLAVWPFPINGAFRSLRAFAIFILHDIFMRNGKVFPYHCNYLPTAATSLIILTWETYLHIWLSLNLICITRVNALFTEAPVKVGDAQLPRCCMCGEVDHVKCLYPEFYINGNHPRSRGRSVCCVRAICSGYMFVCQRAVESLNDAFVPGWLWSPRTGDMPQTRRAVSAESFRRLDETTIFGHCFCHYFKTDINGHLCCWLTTA